MQRRGHILKLHGIFKARHLGTFVAPALEPTIHENARSRTRNIGIIAHIDAGKTTTTEKLLYLSGMTRSVGNVDSGTTITDYLDIERERGITVQSAVVHFDWRGHRINLIDTPGHVDFTMEVERSLRVMDGVVLILDSSVGVQAQTLTVCYQAAKFNLPTLILLNKIDKDARNIEKAIDSIHQKLQIKTILTSALITDEHSKIIGIIDLIEDKWLDVTKDNPQWTSVSEDAVSKELHAKMKEEMFYSLADCDKQFYDEFLNENQGIVQNMKPATLIQVPSILGLRRATLNRTGAVVVCGSGLKWNASIKPILDGVINYLPNPEENNNLSKYFGDGFGALVYKILHDKRKGRLSYLRVYTGNLKNNAHVFNPISKVNEGPVKLFVPYGDELAPVNTISTGDIAVMAGLKKTKTGDTLLETESLGWEAGSKYLKENKTLKEISHDDHRKLMHNVALPSISIVKDVKTNRDSIVLTGIETPDPVYYCSVEPPSTSLQHEFEKAIEEICAEDPSMRAKFNPETGQMIIETMGELHLEVIKDHFKRTYGLKVFFGPQQIAYQEMIQAEISHSKTFEENFGDRLYSVTLNLIISPSSKEGKFKRISLNLPSNPAQIPPRSDWITAINEGCLNALQNGPLLGFPVHNVSISLEGFAASGGKIPTALISACANSCVREALLRSTVHLAEPMMKLEILNQTSEFGIQPILQELAKRRGEILKIDGEKTITISSTIPLAEMSGLASTIRTLSSGFASLHAQVYGYQILSEHDQVALINRLRSI